MWDNVLSMASKESLFALLFITLLVYFIRRNEKREEDMKATNKEREDKYIAREEKYIEREVKYQALVEQLSSTIKDELCGIKDKLGDIIKK